MTGPGKPTPRELELRTITTIHTGKSIIALGDVTLYAESAPLLDWYKTDGQIQRSPVDPIQDTLALHLSQYRRKEDGKLPTPLQVMAMIQKDDPIIHNSAWFAVHLPLICPVLVAWKQVHGHFETYNADTLKLPNPDKPNNAPSLSNKLDYCLGFMLQVLWTRLKRQELWMPTDDARDDEGKEFFRAITTKNHLAQFMDYLVQEVWKQRELTTTTTTATTSPEAPRGTSSMSAPQDQAQAAAHQTKNTIVSPTTTTGSNPTDPQATTAESAAQEMKRLEATHSRFDYKAWYNNKAEWMINNSKGSVEDFDLEMALATMWYVFAHTNQKVFDKLRDWDLPAFLKLSKQEEQWFAVEPGQLSPMALGMKEAKNVQEYWEKTNMWWDPLYPIHWEEGGENIMGYRPPQGARN